MVKLLIGKKLGMTQVFDDAGTVTPVTVLEVGPCRVVQVRSEDRDGYRAVQIGYEPRKAKRTPKPQKGHFKAAGVDDFIHLRANCYELLKKLQQKTGVVS